MQSKLLCEVFENSDIRIEGIAYEELSLYLALTRSTEELVDAGLDSVCPTRKGNRRRPEITASGVKVKKEDRFDPWNRPQNQPDVQKRRMLKEAFRAVLLVIMTNHT